MNKVIQSKKIPKLRFPEFSGEWEEKRLGEVCVINPNARKLPDRFIYIDLESVEKGILKQKKEILKSEAPSRAQRLLKKGDVLFQMVRPYQQNNFFFKENGIYVASTGYAQIRAKQSSMFLYQYFHTKIFLNKVLARCTGTSYPAINSNDFKRIKIFIPSLSEQQRIDGFLSAVDERIEVLQKKREALVKYKKGIMQKIFPAKGEKVPEIRFKDDNGKDFSEWEEKRLGEIGEIKTSSIDKKIRKGEREVWLLNYMDVYKRDMIRQSDKFQKITAKDSQIKSCNLIKGDILFTPSSEIPTDIGHSAVVMEDLNNVVFSYHLVRLRLKRNILIPKFSAYVFKNFAFYKELWRKAQGATRFTISKDAFESSKVLIPSSFDEQQKIANFLSAIDKKIEILDNKIEEMRKWKKGLMQGLFV